ncbi:hypothetical protein B0A50_02589 [Salinomyces thailandicus]|uniref:Uncharacterized protein n=1 Tax=Salinomyces thailandicus TaxID=706561 RepID=A0A4U0U6W8_9PEZI|nr:hypothetical protein B0A50_02589 [Salinomyces thailandica]
MLSSRPASGKGLNQNYNGHDWRVVHDVPESHEHPSMSVQGDNFFTERPLSSSSTSSWYTAQASSDSSSGNAPSGPRVSPVSERRSPTLRRKTSPTEISLRQLHEEQAQSESLRARISEERLQRVYEAQILEYLGASSGQHDSIEEQEESADVR